MVDRNEIADTLSRAVKAAEKNLQVTEPVVPVLAKKVRDFVIRSKALLAVMHQLDDSELERRYRAINQDADKLTEDVNLVTQTVEGVKRTQIQGQVNSRNNAGDALAGGLLGGYVGSGGCSRNILLLIILIWAIVKLL